MTALAGRVREGAVVVSVAIALAVITSWPLASRLRTGIAEPGVGDAYIQAWQVAWGGHALATQPLDYFQANIFWPNDDSLAFTDALIGYAPTALVGSGATAAVVRYNLLFMFAYVLPFVGAYLLARELGIGRAGAFVAGAAFAYAPFRIDQAGHLHVISSGGIPLALFALSRGYRRVRPAWVIGGFLIAAWQVSIGFTLGLQLAYLLGVIALWAVVRAAYRRELPFDRALLLPTAVGVTLFVGYCAWQAAPYLRVAREHPQAARTLADVEFYSPPARGFLAAAERNRVWGEATAGVRSTLIFPTEQTLFPGGAIVVLATAGALGGAATRKLRARLAAGTIFTAVLALGTNPWFGDFLFGMLFRYGPGWDGTRTPGRLMTLTSLGLALLAALGAELLRKPVARQTRVAALVPLMLVGAVVLEGAGTSVVVDPEMPPPGNLAAPEPQLHVPSDDLRDRVYTFWSTEGFPEMVNGIGGFPVQSHLDMRAIATTFPDAGSVAELRARGVASVVLHPETAPGTPWQDAATRSIEGLGITRTTVGGVVIFELDPSNE